MSQTESKHASTNGNWIGAIGILCFGLALLVFLTPTAFAVDDGPFELDGNAADFPAGPPDDWETLYDGGGSQIEFTGIVADPAPLTIYTGGSKDTRDLDQNGVTSGSSPDKDEILDAYAAAYNVGEDLVIYFGADRYANSGDAFLGFWFLDNEVGILDGNFTDVHTTNDVLVLVNFENGGLIPTVEVLQWDPSCKKAAGPNPVPGECGATNLMILAKNAALCDGSGGKDYCAITNEIGVPSFWAYTPKPNTGVSGEFPPQTFFEGGINITEVLHQNVCISSFIAETRSSSSETAQLKDLVLHSFNVCKVEMSKGCKTDWIYNETNDRLESSYTISVHNSGFGPVNDITVTDDHCTPDDTSDDVEHTIATIGAGATVYITSECSIASGSTLGIKNGAWGDAGNVDVVLDGCIIDEDYPDLCRATCNAALNPSIEVNKDCNAKLYDAGDNIIVQVDFWGSVQNTSNGDTQEPLSDVQVAEILGLDGSGNPILGDPLRLYSLPCGDAEWDEEGSYLGTSIRLEPGDFAYFCDYYDPSELNNECAAEAVFSDTVAADGIGLFSGSSVGDEGPADCALCATCSP